MQADPIRAPARAQDLILRHRVKGYRAGDLERRYAELDVEEDFFVNYGFVTRSLHALMHPRSKAWWLGSVNRRARAILDFVRERGSVHPREVDGQFGHGTVRNYWGGSSNATTHLMDGLHYRGLLRVVRRQDGIRIYSARGDAPVAAKAAERRARLDALVDAVVHQYAPLPGASLSMLVNRLRYAAPQWRGELRETSRRARERLAHANVDGVEWYWPSAEVPRHERPDALRLLTPFDPVVWDRRRFEHLLGLGLPLRGVHAGAEAQARLLRAPAPVAGPGDRLGQRLRRGGRASRDVRIRAGRAAARGGLQARAGIGARRHAEVPRRSAAVSRGERATRATRP